MRVLFGNTQSLNYSHICLEKKKKEKEKKKEETQAKPNNINMKITFCSTVLLTKKKRNKNGNLCGNLYERPSSIRAIGKKT